MRSLCKIHARFFEPSILITLRDDRAPRMSWNLLGSSDVLTTSGGCLGIIKRGASTNREI